MAKMAMHKLAVLGAKHLLKGGHINKSTHGKMVKAAKGMKPPKMELMDAPPEVAAEQPLQFGSLDPMAMPAAAPSPLQGPAIGPPMGMLGSPPLLR